MDSIYLLIPIAIFLAALAIAIFFWAVRSGQFEDLEGPAHKILMDEAVQKKLESENISSGELLSDENPDARSEKDQD